MNKVLINRLRRLKLSWSRIRLIILIRWILFWGFFLILGDVRTTGVCTFDNTRLGFLLPFCKDTACFRPIYAVSGPDYSPILAVLL